MKKIFILFTFVLLFLFTPMQVCAATVTYKISAKTEIDLLEGETIKLTLSKKYKNVKWSSSNKEIATVSKNGKVIAVEHGKTKITAKSGKKKFICTVYVYEEEIVYENDIAEPNNDDDFGEVLSPDTEYTFEYEDKKTNDDEALKARIKDMIKNNKAVSDDD